MLDMSGEGKENENKEKHHTTPISMKTYSRSDVQLPYSPTLRARINRPTPAATVACTLAYYTHVYSPLSDVVITFAITRVSISSYYAPSEE
jgi:hypothetical protein